MKVFLRRGWLAGLISGVGACCLVACSTVPPTTSGERIVEQATGRILSCAELAQAIQGADYALLGELHDEPSHHQRRGALLARLKAPAAVVAEQLPRGPHPVRLGPDLLASLTAAGFEPEDWAWPVHQALFAGVAQAGLPLTGGNLSDQQLQAVVRRGPGSLPRALQALVEAAPLSADAQATLDADLVQAHGGRIQARQLQVMNLAQRARDASLLTALAESRAQPAVLVAGNGHVRLDYGVPQMIQAVQPGARVISVGLLRLEQAQDLADEPYTHVWIVDPTRHGHPACGAN
jgi:uncharacterized iron-regulated protein